MEVIRKHIHRGLTLALCVCLLITLSISPSLCALADTSAEGMATATDPVEFDGNDQAQTVVTAKIIGAPEIVGVTEDFLINDAFDSAAIVTALTEALSASAPAGLQAKVSSALDITDFGWTRSATTLDGTELEAASPVVGGVRDDADPTLYVLPLDVISAQTFESDRVYTYAFWVRDKAGQESRAHIVITISGDYEEHYGENALVDEMTGVRVEGVVHKDAVLVVQRLLVDVSQPDALDPAAFDELQGMIDGYMAENAASIGNGGYVPSKAWTVDLKYVDEEGHEAAATDGGNVESLFQGDISLLLPPGEGIREGDDVLVAGMGRSVSERMVCLTKATAGGASGEMRTFSLSAMAESDDGLYARVPNAFLGTYMLATYSDDVVTVQASAEGEGVIAPSGALRREIGSRQAFRFSPLSSEYKLQRLEVGGNDVTSQLVGAKDTYTLTVPAGGTTVVAHFGKDPEKPKEYNLTTRVEGGHGTIWVGGVDVTGKTLPYPSNEPIGIVFNPEAGYHLGLATIKVGEVSPTPLSVSGTTYTLMGLEDDTVITARFEAGEPEPEGTHVVILDVVGAHGSINQAGRAHESVTVPDGASPTFSLLPDEGYKVSYVREGDVDMTSAVDEHNVLTVPNVISHRALVVGFEEDPDAVAADRVTITTRAIGHGVISPEGPVTVERGASYSFTLMPDPGYRVSSVTLNGVVKSVGSLQNAADNTYSYIARTFTLSNVQYDTELVVTFAPETVTDGMNAAQKVAVKVGQLARTGDSTTQLIALILLILLIVAVVAACVAMVIMRRSESNGGLGRGGSDDPTRGDSDNGSDSGLPGSGIGASGRS